MTVLPTAVLLAAACLAIGGCTDDAPIVIDLAAAADAGGVAQITRTVAGAREITIVTGDRELVVEAWLDGAALSQTADADAAREAAGASASWLVPRAVHGELVLTATGDGTHALTVWARGNAVPAARRERALAWFDPALLDDTTIISPARVLDTIARDGRGNVLLDRWFRAFAVGPGAGRATFQQFLDRIATTQGADPATWDLRALPFRVTGVHNRVDLARGDDCGELRVSIASTDATFSPLHLIVLFRQVQADDDVTPDGAIHCRGTARRWARLGALDGAQWTAAARAAIDAGLTRDRFLLAESVELSLSPWQWRQWVPDSNGGLANPRLFQTIDVARVNTAGTVREQFLLDVVANNAAIAARTWRVPDPYRATTAEVQPNAKATLVDLSPLAVDPALPQALGMIGCPRCHTDDADFVQTSVDRVPSPFYDKELTARGVRLDALTRGAWPGDAPFGPLQPLQPQ